MNEPAHRTRRSLPLRLARAIVLGMALVTLGLLGLIAANLALRKPPPDVLWTEADLPQVPDASSNGWVSVQHEAAHRVPASLPSALAGLTAQAPASAAWAEAQRQKESLAALLAEPQFAVWIPTMDAAVTSPRFADACPPRLDASCEDLRVFTLLRLYELTALDQGLRGGWDEAFARAMHLAALELDFAKSYRRALTGVIAIKLCIRTMNLLDVLVAGYETADARERAQVAAPTVRRLDSLLGSFDETTMDLRRMVVGEYLFAVSALDTVAKSPGLVTPDAGRLGPLAGLLFDRSETLRLVNVQYRQLAQYASAPLGPPPSFAPHATGAGWWLRNPVGKQALDAMMPMLGSVLHNVADERASCLQKRDVVRPRMNAVLGR